MSLHVIVEYVPNDPQKSNRRSVSTHPPSVISWSENPTVERRITFSTVRTALHAGAARCFSRIVNLWVTNGLPFESPRNTVTCVPWVFNNNQPHRQQNRRRVGHSKRLFGGVTRFLEGPKLSRNEVTMIADTRTSPDEFASSTHQLANYGVPPFAVRVSQTSFDDVRTKFLFRESNEFAIHFLLQLDRYRLWSNIQQVLQVPKVFLVLNPERWPNSLPLTTHRFSLPSPSPLISTRGIFCGAGYVDPGWYWKTKKPCPATLSRLFEWKKHLKRPRKTNEFLDQKDANTDSKRKPFANCSRKSEILTRFHFSIFRMETLKGSVSQPRRTKLPRAEKPRRLNTDYDLKSSGAQ